MFFKKWRGEASKWCLPRGAGLLSLTRCAQDPCKKITNNFADSLGLGSCLREWLQGGFRLLPGSSEQLRSRSQLFTRVFDLGPYCGCLSSSWESQAGLPQLLFDFRAHHSLRICLSAGP